MKCTTPHWKLFSVWFQTVLKIIFSTVVTFSRIFVKYIVWERSTYSAWHLDVQILFKFFQSQNQFAQDWLNLKCNQFQWRSSLLKSWGLRRGTFSRATFYCIFGRFGEVIYLVNLKKWGRIIKPHPPAPLVLRPCPKFLIFSEFCQSWQHWLKQYIHSKKALFLKSSTTRLERANI